MTDQPDWAAVRPWTDAADTGTGTGEARTGEAWSGRRAASSRWWLALAAAGVLSILLGVAVLVWPGATLSVLAVLIGLWLILSGVMRVVTALTDSVSGTAHQVLGCVIGVLFAVAGVLCLRNLVNSLALLIVVVALNWLLSGVVEVVAALGAQGPHRLARSLLGVLGMLTGVALLAWPHLTLGLVVVFIGIGAIVVGFTQLGFALSVRHAPAT